MKNQKKRHKVKIRGKLSYIEFFHKNCKMSPLFIFFQFTSKIESKIENFNLGGLRLMITACAYRKTPHLVHKPFDQPTRLVF